MKKIVFAGLTLVAMAGAAFADPLEGTWQTKPDDNGNFGYIQVAPCGDKFCGVLTQSFGPDGKPMASDNIGKQIIWNMVAQGNGNYGNGKIWAPDRNKTYDSKLHLEGNTLSVSGCVFFICRDGGTWTRVN
ncbi:MAG: DUF2147 domain-containing protein [Limimaricola sp.]|uniref:DUF2147 domain-containing protein n=1 Tax=Limimaricola sp. TaxID=2211665 RepID=UPI001DB18302|nr:DUF2147 domain-containing protein [Limimaricola sp.]MBI1418910.1 DUF2147 domain-containing protein [Limimaricola sp.]